jgi:predicted DNA binding CopG/RHH family protein
MKKIKHNFNLTPEEQSMHDAVVRGGYISVPNVEAEKLRAVEIAKNTLAKNKAITVRVSERNLVRLKAAAAREGVPYQTFISSLIQKHT